jgi:phosphoribosylaminoimidazolecarboxamide formyltransferase/IMP cyclohydrolase
LDKVKTKMKKIRKAIVSVYYKEGLETLIQTLHKQEVEIYSTGGSYTFVTNLGIPCHKVEDLTSYPEILGGRVKTLHPGIFGGLLARSENETDQQEMATNNLPFFDLMICNLYPFQEYLDNHASEEELIEKIDIGGVTLIRAAAKNFKEVVCISDSKDYGTLQKILEDNNGETTLEDRKNYARIAFQTIAKYDQAIANWFANEEEVVLRYGENPHQKGRFVGDFDALFDKVNGKEISYNNMLDIDACMRLMNDFDFEPSFAIIKHNNSCGLASRSTISEAYSAALACDPTSAFGGVLISNRKIDFKTAQKMNTLFFEIIIAPGFEAEALELLKGKKNRIILIQKTKITMAEKLRSVLNGQLVQDSDNVFETATSWNEITKRKPTKTETEDLEFGIRAVKHLKSNGIALVKNKQLIGMGCGQTSRVDALTHAIRKSKEFGFDLSGAIMASDAFFPFADCVEIAHQAGIVAVAQPGGSVKDSDSIAYCDNHNLAMVMTGVRHFNH